MSMMLPPSRVLREPLTRYDSQVERRVIKRRSHRRVRQLTRRAAASAVLNGKSLVHQSMYYHETWPKNTRLQSVVWGDRGMITTDHIYLDT